VKPPSTLPPLIPWDKAAHFLAFYVLTVLAAAAFPRRTLLLLAVALSAYGALIELIQAHPAIGRDSDIWDWVADTAAIAAALLPLLISRWRDRIGMNQQGAALLSGEGPHVAASAAPKSLGGSAPGTLR